ncbi:MAG: flavin oxidoreductase [Flammeovirgaceae bacterium]|nr:flavin oxidoreductase [Flammeovirgaceae bacterium]
MNFIDSKQISEFSKVYRLNLINSITGYKPANLIGSKSSKGLSNLAIFSSVIHLGSKPPLIGIVTRPNTVPRDTYKNIIENRYYTINHISKNMVERAHFTSAKFSEDESEFHHCNFEEEYIMDFDAPFVKESKIKIGMQLVEEKQIETNNTILIVGEVKNITIDKESLEDDGSVNLRRDETVCISGLDTYYETNKISKYPYARKDNLPF